MKTRQTNIIPWRYAKKFIMHHNRKFVEKYIYKISGESSNFSDYVDLYKHILQKQGYNNF